MVEEVKVTRKYQVTIPRSVRSELGIHIGDKLIVKADKRRIIMEIPERIPDPSDVLWNLFGRPLNVDAVKLVEESWVKTAPPNFAKLSKRKPEERT